MDTYVQKRELIDIMETMDDCLDEIKRALDKLDFDIVSKLVTVLTEAFIAVNETLDNHNTDEALHTRLEYDRRNVNHALEEVLATYDNHDMEIRYSSYDSLRSSLLIWTGHVFDALQLQQ